MLASPLSDSDSIIVNRITFNYFYGFEALVETVAI